MLKIKFKKNKTDVTSGDPGTAENTSNVDVPKDPAAAAEDPVAENAALGPDQNPVTPVKLKKHKKIKPEFIIKTAIVLILIAFICVSFILPAIANTKIQKDCYVVESEKINAPVYISFLTDLHLAEFGEKNCDLIAAIREQNPDIIAMGGDMTTMGETDISVLTDLCKALTEIAPVYYVFGNHEFHDVLFTDTPIVDELTNAGVHILWDGYETISVNGNLIDIGGLCEDPKQFEEYGRSFWDYYMQSENFRLLLVHDPAYYDDGKYVYTGNGALIGEDVDLALCGHRHGGQVIIPGLGGLYHPDTGLFPKLYGGRYEIEGTTVIVSRGLGNEKKFPRINNRPELVLIELC